MLTMADYLRDFARTDKGAECLPEEHLCWEAANEVERLRYALEVIAGRKPALDNLMSNVEIAEAALDHR